MGEQVGAPGRRCLRCHHGGGSVAARRMATVLPALGVVLASGHLELLQQLAVAEESRGLHSLPPSRGGRWAPSAPQCPGVTHVVTGLCVATSELWMCRGSCGVNNLSAPVSHQGSLMDPLRWYQSVLQAVTPRGGGRPGAWKPSGAVLPPCCPPPPSSHCSHTLSFPLLSRAVPPCSQLPASRCSSPVSRGVRSPSRTLEMLPANVSVCCLPAPWGKGLETQRGRSSGSEGKPLFLTACLLHFLMGKHSL